MTCEKKGFCELVKAEQEAKIILARNIEKVVKRELERIISSLGENNSSLSSEIAKVGEASDVTEIVSHLVSLLETQVKNNQDLILKAESSMKELEAEGEKLKRDNLTGLFNRHKLEERFKVLSSTGDNLSICVIDIDNFKRLNDTFGHLCGDQVLKFIAKKLLDIFPNESVFRYGGEEFVVMIPAPAEKTHTIIDNLLTTIRNTQLEYQKKHKFKVTFTGGVTDYNIGETFEDIFNRADELLYIGKRSGKERILIKPEKIT